MNNNAILITCDNDSVAEQSGAEDFFSLQNTGVLLVNVENSHYDDELEKLVFLVTKKPKCLSNHTQRISYCFQKIFNCFLKFGDRRRSRGLGFRRKIGNSKREKVFYKNELFLWGYEFDHFDQ